MNLNPAESRQLVMNLGPENDECQHRYGFVTMAYVPCGVVCCDCGILVLQYLPESPAAIGYISADWAWHHRDGKAWTTQTR